MEHHWAGFYSGFQTKSSSLTAVPKCPKFSIEWDTSHPNRFLPILQKCPQEKMPSECYLQNVHLKDNKW